VAVDVILTSTGFIIAAIRQRSRRKRALSDQCILPAGSPSSYWNTITRPSAGRPVSVSAKWPRSRRQVRHWAWLSADPSVHHV